MLNQPFSSTVIRRPPPTPQVPAPTPTNLDYALPLGILERYTLVQTASDLERFFLKEVRTERLDDMITYLWLAGLPRCCRPLHRQQLLGREIIITEDVNEHLVWYQTRFSVKPLPLFLLDVDCWAETLCNTKVLHEAACGFLLSYVWPIRHESDFRIAQETGLLPSYIDWATWRGSVNDFLDHINLQSLEGISSRYQYGELRLSRLNKIHFLRHSTWESFVQAYMRTLTWDQGFFARNFTKRLAVFAVGSVALSAMLVVLSTKETSSAFDSASIVFACIIVVGYVAHLIHRTLCQLAYI